MKTADEFLEDYLSTNNLPWSPEMEKQIGCVYNAMIEFAKMHVLKIKHLQQSKYYSGETGYIKSEEWENIINNIK